MSNPTLKEVLERRRRDIMQIKGVIGIAAGMSKTDPKKHCIQIFARTDDWPDGVPHRLDGYEVELVKTSGFRAF